MSAIPTVRRERIGKRRIYFDGDKSVCLHIDYENGETNTLMFDETTCAVVIKELQRALDEMRRKGVEP